MGGVGREIRYIEYLLNFFFKFTIMKKPLTYRVLLIEEPEGGFTVNVPALQGCITYGENLSHAMEMAKEAIEGYVELLKEQGQPIPDDSNTFEYSITLAS